MRVPFLLLTLFVFSIPWEKTVSIDSLGTISRAIGIAALAAGALDAFGRRSLRRLNLVLTAAAAFTVWTACSYFWSLAPADTAVRSFTFVQLLAMMWLIWEVCRTESEQRILMSAYVVGAVVASAATIWRYFEGQQTYYRRYAAPGFDPNDLGLTVALAIPLALYFSGRDRTAAAWLYRAAIVPIIASILLTASRTAWVATVLAFAFAAVTWAGAAAGHRVASVLLLCGVLSGPVLLAPRASRERLSTLPAELSGGTLHNRTRIWKTGLKVFKSHPVAGVGSGAYAKAVEPWLGRPAIAGHEYVAHNTFISVLVETGIVGFVLFVLLLAAVVWFIWLMMPPERALWATMLGVWLIGVSTLTWEHRKPTWLMIALITTEWARAFRPRGKT